MKLRLAMALGTAVTSLSATAWLLPRHGADGPPANQEQTASGQSAAKYLGVDNCKDCHGKSEPQTNKRGTSTQVEYKTWSGSDRHSKAFAVLLEPKSEQIARSLAMKTLPKQWENAEKPPDEWNRCLNCHSMNFISESQRGQKFKLADGVSCDGCHGPAENWLGPHQERDYSESLKLGMKNIRNPVVRAEMCLSCHLGSHTKAKIVDHEMIAAGHPRLVFELDAYCQKLPPHWQPKEPKDGNLPRAQLWAAGQLVALREAVRLLADDLKSDRWPEYSHFDCASCHHDLKDEDWRKNPLSRIHFSAMMTRFPPGRPPWQPGQLAVPAWLMAGTLTGDDTPEGYTQMMPVLDRQFLGVPFGNPQIAAEFADQASKMVDEMVKRVETKRVDAEYVRKSVATFSKVTEAIAWRGHTAALQLTYAHGALLSQSGLVDAGYLKRLEEIQKELESVDAAARYDPREFLKQMGDLNRQFE